jgi:hypothetical protein
MLISPPFLTNAGSSISASFSGEYPVTSHMEWHNGLHLIAPVDEDHHAEVRAIADGKLIYVRAPDAQPGRDKHHPQNYAAFGDGPEWTDKGMVIVEHRTEIGATGNRPTEIVYYSVYAQRCRLPRLHGLDLHRRRHQHRRPALRQRAPESADHQRVPLMSATVL